MSLKNYHTKRDFSRTREPKGAIKSSGRTLHFVVQRHDARQLHYDFRLELDGVLKSWAVPKGPSLNPADKRLAVMVEDHPYAYRKFEGTIPKGNYGAGKVEIWDEGTYEALEKQAGKDDETVLRQALQNGSLKFILHGKKLNGEFALVRMKQAAEDNAWLLIKHKDAYAKTTSDAEKKDNSVPKPVPAKNARAAYRTNEKKYNHYIKPMLATIAGAPFTDKDWVFEIKWDGYRAIAEVGKQLRLYSRNGLNFTNRYNVIAQALQQQQQEMILDGEIVAYNEAGLPDFQALQHFEEAPNVPIIYHVFDLLRLNGHNTETLTLLQRKELLKKALTESDTIKYCDHVIKDGKKLFTAIQKKNLEGMIAKNATSAYVEGTRSRSWLKIKHHHTEEVIIAGYTAPRGSRKKFGALILGRYKDSSLVYAGHTGTGFDELSLTELYEKMQPLATAQCPFEAIPKTNTAAVWLQPRLVCNIKFSELTKDHIFRQPVFQGLREDKAATEIIIPQNETVMPGKTKPQPAQDGPLGKAAYTIKEGRKEVKLTNQHKIYWPDEGFTKGDLVNYYNTISPFILPYLKDRPESLNRYPNGIAGESFYQKDAGESIPGWLKTTRVYSESTRKDIDYIVCNDRLSLLYLANLGCIELNPWNSTAKKPEAPTYMIIDIDPSEKNTFEQVIEAALATKQVLDDCGAPSFCKTSGATGLHVYVPLDNKYTYEQVKDFAHLIAQHVTALLPESTTLERNLKKRGTQKIYIDHLQNRRGQTVASAYSVRPRPGATVSAPLQWKEVKPGLTPGQFTMQSMHKRLDKTGDIFAPVLGKGIDMLKCLKKING